MGYGYVSVPIRNADQTIGQGCETYVLVYKPGRETVISFRRNTMNRFTFWQKWLFIVGLGITTFGLFMAFFNQTPLFDLFNRQIDPAFWGSAPLPEGVTSSRPSPGGASS
jgi:hypothetical protein